MTFKMTDKGLEAFIEDCRKRDQWKPRVMHDISSDLCYSAGKSDKDLRRVEKDAKFIASVGEMGSVVGCELKRWRSLVPHITKLCTEECTVQYKNALMELVKEVYETV